MFRAFLLTTILMAAHSQTASAERLVDHLGPRAVALGDSGRADAKGSSATVLNPAGLALDRRLVFSGSFGYRDTDGASIGAVSACDSTVPVPGCFYYKYLKADSGIDGMDTGRRLHEFGSSLSRILSPQIAFGLTARYFDYNSDLTGDEDTSGYATDAGLIFTPTPSLRVAAVGHNLLGSDSIAYPRGLGSGITFTPAEQLSISVDGLWNLELEDTKTGRFGGGIEYLFTGQNALSAYPIRIGGVFDRASDNGYLNAGFGFASAKIGIDIGGRKQISGSGDELIIQAGITLVGATPSPGR